MRNFIQHCINYLNSCANNVKMLKRSKFVLCNNCPYNTL